jgi:predicted Mrr-cat superfamily restriction endonuclease
MLSWIGGVFEAGERGWVGCDALPEIDFTGFCNLQTHEVEAQILTLLKERNLETLKRIVKARTLVTLISGLQIEDKVAVYHPEGGLRIGLIAGPYEYHASTEHPHRRLVDWSAERYTLEELWGMGFPR